MKRYLRIDFEYENDVAIVLGHPTTQILAVVARELPHVKALFTRESSERNRLDTIYATKVEENNG